MSAHPKVVVQWIVYHIEGNVSLLKVRHRNLKSESLLLNFDALPIEQSGASTFLFIEERLKSYISKVL